MESTYIAIIDGTEYGPVDPNTLNTWVAEGRLRPTSILVEVQTGQRSTAAEQPFLRDRFPSVPPPPQAVAPPPGYHALTGVRHAAGAANESGTGPAARLPVELQGFNWGAFLLPFFWAIAHNTWIGLLCLVPVANVIITFVLGFKGNEWAWQNRRWDSIEQFRSVQRTWALWGVGLIVLSFIFGIALVILAVLASSSAQYQYQ